MPALCVRLLTTTLLLSSALNAPMFLVGVCVFGVTAVHAMCGRTWRLMANGQLELWAQLGVTMFVLVWHVCRLDFESPSNTLKSMFQPSV